MTDDELLDAAERLRAKLIAEGDPFSGDDWELMRIVERCIRSIFQAREG